MSYNALNHVSVLYEETMESLAPEPHFQVLDCTLGGGGHSQGFLTSLDTSGHLYGIEQDPQAIDFAKERLSPYKDKMSVIQGNFGDLETLAEEHNLPLMDIIFADLGTSMFQMKSAERGFSFMQSGPLDMRMNPEQSLTAADIVKNYATDDLSRIFYAYGEERSSRHFARAIVEARKKIAFETTDDLAGFILKIAKGRKKRHPATQIFQALRIEVNRELSVLEGLLPQAVNLLKPGGKLGVITFHSLEDRMVKQFFKTQSKDCLCPPRQPMCTCDHQAKLKIVTRKGIVPSEKEIKKNAPSRSARLRIAQKI